MATLFLFLTICYVYIPTVTLISTAARDTLTPCEPLRDGQTLVSPNGRFVLGFFTPSFSVSSSNMIVRHLGIWYNEIPILTVVWVANRFKPLTTPLGKLVLDTDGGLAIQDGAARSIWTVPRPSGTVHNPVLQLLDSGNLVVRDGNNNSDKGYLWESFDYPCDTLLPGMKLGWDYKSSLKRMMTSWRTNDDPVNGDFSLSLELLNQSPELVLLGKNSAVQSRWGPWDGQQFSGSHDFKSNPVFRTMFVSNADEFYIGFEGLDKTILYRFVVSPWGNIEFLKWKNHTNEWIQILTLNKDSCDRYGSCGRYGICYNDDPSCRCLQGFAPSSPQDWDRLDCTGGCNRKHKLNCSDADGFVKYEGLKLPDNSTVWKDLSPAECVEKCLMECACMAYTNLDVYGNGSQCVVWLADLVDIRILGDSGHELYIRMGHKELELLEKRKTVTTDSFKPVVLPESITSSKREKEVMLIVVSLLSTICAILVLALAIRYITLVTQARRRATIQGNIPYQESTGDQHEDMEIQLYNMDTISTATNNFASFNKVGQGGFGSVYKGELSSGQQVAVKKLLDSSGQGLQEFKNEASLIAKLQHRNLVKLLGCCIQGGDRMLVYEYLPNGSLDQFIFGFDQFKKRLLPWEKRFSIIKGVAKGLVYLHDDSRLRIIHRDLKASNILLDNDMNPKISDFGLARSFQDETEETTRRVVGTHGYMPPEYIMHGQFSTKSDVYSFGVLALEILSGRKNWGFHHPDHDFNLLGHAWKLWNEGNPLELMDPVLELTYNEDEMIQCIQVGLLCVQQRADDRPTMASVVSMLRSESASLPEPQQPGFFNGRSTMWMGSSSCGQTPETSNGVTVSTMCGR
ncbi:hypothetical protein RJ640_017562 [Escallonia rubra]|uniref:Receptor-like serine/threonine-protein kinase n=1 Tax=Escallonia rubra TaxID=112253 RepID=A0AA88RD41_9ASTE|nr:hypothetical protein RJ640_017562 [Escallonia rubra]